MFYDAYTARITSEGTIKKITTHDPSLVERLSFKSFLCGQDFVAYTTYDS